MFQNSQPIHYDPNLRPPIGGLCIHRPIHYDETNNSNNNTSTASLKGEGTRIATVTTNPTDDNIYNDHDQFLAFTRNIMLQTPITRKEIQSSRQYTKQNSHSHSYRRIDYLFNNALQKNRFQCYGDSKKDRNGKKKSNGSGNSATSSNGGKRGRKRKVVEVNNDNLDLDDASNTTTTSVATTNHVRLDSTIAKNEHGHDDNLNHGKTNDRHGLQKGNGNVVALGLENDEQFLEYLQTRHNGNVQRAQLSLLSNLCRGTGEYMLIQCNSFWIELKMIITCKDLIVGKFNSFISKLNQ